MLLSVCQRPLTSGHLEGAAGVGDPAGGRTHRHDDNPRR